MYNRDFAPVRVKICGITRLEDALAAVAAGADAIGFVFYAASPRAVSALQAAEIMACLPPFVTTVGLFVDATEADIRATLAVAPVSLLQFHGDEPEADCLGYGRPWIKALRIKPEDDVSALMAQWPKAQGILLDAWHPHLHGGTGLAFDWAQVPVGSTQALILAGGLTAENVAEAIRQTRPYAVDVSGGVEASKGVKDTQKIQAFMAGVRSV